MEFGHVGNFKVEHEDLLELEEVAVPCCIRGIPRGARGLVDHECHTHHVGVLLLFEHSLKLEVLRSGFAIEPQEFFLVKEGRADIIRDDIRANVGNRFFFLFILSLFLFNLSFLESEPFPVDKLVLGEFVVDVLEAEVRLEGVVVDKDHVLGFASLITPDGSIQKD